MAASASSHSLDDLDDDQLVALWAAVMTTLKARGIVRSANNPTADIGERVAAALLSLTLVGGVVQGHDAVDGDGQRYQIKAHRRAPGGRTRKLGVIRKLEAREFEFVVAVIFDSTLVPEEVWRVPYEAVVEHATFVPTLNGHRLKAGVWADARVQRVELGSAYSQPAAP